MIRVLTAVLLTLGATSVAAQTLQPVPRLGVGPKRSTTSPIVPELNLPNFLGEGTGAARVWITPVLIARSYESDQISAVTPGAIPNVQFPSQGQRPSGQPPYNIPGPLDGLGSLPRHPGPAESAPPPTSHLVQSISVVNANRTTAIEVFAECYGRDGGRIPTLSKRETLGARGILQWAPAIYRGAGDGQGTREESFWCVVSASQPMIAHARTRGFDYVQFTVGSK